MNAVCISQNTCLMSSSALFWLSMVNLEAASLETGSGFSREYFSRAANPLGGPETSLQNRIPISWFIYRSEKKIVSFSEAAAPSAALWVGSEQRPGPGEAAALRRQGAPVPRSAAPSERSAMLPRAARPAQPGCQPLHVFSFLYGRIPPPCCPRCSLAGSSRRLLGGGVGTGVDGWALIPGKPG